MRQPLCKWLYILKLTRNKAEIKLWWERSTTILRKVNKKSNSPILHDKLIMRYNRVSTVLINSFLYMLYHCNTLLDVVLKLVVFYRLAAVRGVPMGWWASQSVDNVVWNRRDAQNIIHIVWPASAFYAGSTTWNSMTDKLFSCMRLSLPLWPIMLGGPRIPTMFVLSKWEMWTFHNSDNLTFVINYYYLSARNCDQLIVDVSYVPCDKRSRRKNE